MPVEPEILKCEEVAKTRLFRVEQVSLRFSNGVECEYERLGHVAQGSVLILPLLNAETVLLIREYCVGSESYQLGLPKGAMDKGENWRDAANRELMEEVGYGAGQLTFLKSLSLSPGYMSNQIEVVLAEDLYAKRLPGDEPEPLEVVPWPLAKIDELIAREDFSEGRSIAALFLMVAHLQKNSD